MKKVAIALFLLFPALCAAQSDNTLYVKQFAGTTVGAKVTAAQASCNPNTIIPCILVIDPSLASWPAGTMPTLCAQCSLLDYRTGAANVPSGMSSDGHNGIKVAGNVMAGIMNGVYNAAQASGADIGAKVNAAYATAAALYTIPTIYVPAGSYTYSTGMSFSGPVTLRCEPGTILDYTGSGNAVTMGPSGLTISTYNPLPYTVDGCLFTGGASAATGIFFNEFITQSFVRNTIFYNFGNSSEWNIFYQGENWVADIDGVYMWINASSSQSYNGIYTNAADPANGTNGDLGQTNLMIANSTIQNSGSGSMGQGVYLNGDNARIFNSNISFVGGPNIQVGGWATDVVITDVYMERPAGTLPCIQYGDKSGVRIGSPTSNLVLQNVYCNVHNLDDLTTAYFLAPASSQSSLKNALLNHPMVNAITSGNVLVQENNISGQTGNIINDLSGTTATHTDGSNISPWGGDSANASYGDTWNLPVIDGVSAKYGIVTVTDGTSSSLILSSSAGENYIESGTANMAGKAPLNITGPSASQLTSMIINSASTATTGSFSASGNVSGAYLLLNGAQSSVSCSTSGLVIFAEPFQGSLDKRVTMYFSACVGTASYTYPTAFSKTPSVFASNNVAASVATSVTATAVTVTGTTTTGTLVLEAY